MLLLTTSEKELILKSLCLQFVITIDELVYTSFTTASAKAKLQRAKIEYSASQHSNLWDNWIGGFSSYVLCVTALLVLTYGVFGNLMLFRKACRAYLSMLRMPSTALTSTTLAAAETGDLATTTT